MHKSKMKHEEHADHKKDKHHEMKKSPAKKMHKKSDTALKAKMAKG